ncbi:DUF2508 family protein [Pelosinus propionicus]|uniref:DUF2508 domain-containing protein n=1 Tax=Pelosinus propionicus DSM 13327 TaxID=1123291 RepID=A0A1I4M0Q7_9FIRM|nr:DUF2508 family protein [Pelosinus propionicus]SFL96655.1 Protein of unknown function [Pelosinus propionicus DSM 13327]
MNIIETLQKIQDYIYGSEHLDPKPLPSLSVVVEEARQEWLNAQHYYNSVSDQDLVDHAVYLMQAAEKKYVYLLKKARQEGIVRSPYTFAGNENDKKQ